jgi:hypothetical protein
VTKDSLKSFGAVSEEVVGEMVTGALSESRANLGPAIPLIATPRLALLSLRAPVTISPTTSSLTAPNDWSDSFVTPRILCFELFE